MIIIFITMAIITAIVADKKGYKRYRGAIAGGLLSLIGLVIFLLMPKTIEKRAEEEKAIKDLISKQN